MTRPIAISLSPNTEKDDVFLAAKALFNPLKWFDRREVEKLEEEFAQWFGGGYHAAAVNSGRSAQYLILKGLGIGQGDEVAIQAFTCVAVPNSVLWTGAKPVYVDVDSTYNMDPKDLKRKLTGKTKAVIVQHTFGIPAKLAAIKRVVRNDIFLLEDCAHALGGTYKGKLLGGFGDAAFFSFGRDKVISSVFGGLGLVRARVKIGKIKGSGVLWTLQQLLHPIAFSLILPLYNLGLGKLLLVGLQKAGLVSKAVYEQEKSCRNPGIFPRQMPPALAVLTLHQLDKLERFNRHRKRIADYYFSKLSGVKVGLPPRVDGAIWLRFPITVDDADGLIEYAKKSGVLLGDWYRNVVMPVKDLGKAGYRAGSCPNAERLARQVVNLPTYPTMSLKDAKTVVHLIKQWPKESDIR